MLTPTLWEFLLRRRIHLVLALLTVMACGSEERGSDAAAGADAAAGTGGQAGTGGTGGGAAGSGGTGGVGGTAGLAGRGGTGGQAPDGGPAGCMPGAPCTVSICNSSCFANGVSGTWTCLCSQQATGATYTCGACLPQ